MRDTLYHTFHKLSIPFAKIVSRAIAEAIGFAGVYIGCFEIVLMLNGMEKTGKKAKKCTIK